MCKEDVRIKRKTAVRTYIIDGTNPSATVIPANPERVALALSVQSSNPGTAPAFAVVGPRVAGGNVAGVLGVSPDRPVDRTTVEQIGMAITDKIEYVDDGANIWVVSVTEVYFTESLGDL